MSGRILAKWEVAERLKLSVRTVEQLPDYAQFNLAQCASAIARAMWTHGSIPVPRSKRERLLAMDTLDQLRLQRHAEHLHCCGPRMIAEVLAEISQQIGGGLLAIIAILAPYQRLTPTVLHVVGGDRFPSRPFRTVPK